MEKKLLTLICFGILQSFYAQTFVEMSDTNISEVLISAIAFSDIDGDNDPDLIVTGRGPENIPISELYINDGDGNFTLMPDTTLKPVDTGSVTFADIDNDGDQDLLIAGTNYVDGTITTTLYTNDGAGNFTEVVGTPFDGFLTGSIDFADIDNDGDLDVLITGTTDAASATARIAKLYTNDGDGNFTEVSGTPFVGVWYSDAAFADIDGDEDLDLIIMGEDDPLQINTRLYTNDGTGNFTEVTSSLQDLALGSVTFLDIDGDNDQDVILCGQKLSPLERLTKLYTNDGAGNFTEIADTPFESIDRSSIAVADVDNDLDILLSGTVTGNPYSNISKLYLNDGVGDFTEFVDAPFEGVDFGSIAFTDIDGDNDQDILITGREGNDATGNVGPVALLYRNDLIILPTENYVLDTIDFNIFPNPISGNKLNLQYVSLDAGVLDIKVFDLRGRVLFEQRENVIPGEQNIDINITSLSTGNYIINLDNGFNIGMRKFIVD